jgi:hypothetical protein
MKNINKSNKKCLKNVKKDIIDQRYQQFLNKSFNIEFINTI